MAMYSPKVPTVETRALEAQPAPIVAFKREYPSGHLVERHCHERAQLIYASKGIMQVDTPDGIWVVPPMRAIWVPAAVEHEMRVSSALHLRTLFVRPGLRESLPKACCVVEVSPLLRELIFRMVELELAGHVCADHLTATILDEIRTGGILPVHVALPTDARLLRICRSILQNPANGHTIAQWGSIVGASSRTLERLFLQETGVCFRIWKQQVRVLAALSRLAAQEPISVVAFDLGYQNPSAFAAMFKRTLGCPPREFFAAGTLQ
jgi:AraC-like DNA-binding protein